MSHSGTLREISGMPQWLVTARHGDSIFSLRVETSKKLAAIRVVREVIAKFTVKWPGDYTIEARRLRRDEVLL